MIRIVKFTVFVLLFICVYLQINSIISNQATENSIKYSDDYIALDTALVDCDQSLTNLEEYMNSCQTVNATEIIAINSNYNSSFIFESIDADGTITYYVDENFSCSNFYQTSSNCQYPLYNDTFTDTNHFFLSTDSMNVVVKLKQDDITINTIYIPTDLYIEYEQYLISKNIFPLPSDFGTEANETNLNTKQLVFSIVLLAIFVFASDILRNKKFLSTKLIHGVSKARVISNFVIKNFLFDVFSILVLSIITYIVLNKLVGGIIAIIQFKLVLSYILKAYILIALISILTITISLSIKNNQLLIKNSVIEKTGNIFIITYLIIYSLTFFSQNFTELNIQIQNYNQIKFETSIYLNYQPVYITPVDKNQNTMTDYYNDSDDLYFILYVSDINASNNAENNQYIQILDKNIVESIYNTTVENDCIIVNNKSELEEDIDVLNNNNNFQNINICTNNYSINTNENIYISDLSLYDFNDNETIGVQVFSKGEYIYSDNKVNIVSFDNSSSYVSILEFEKNLLILKSSITLFAMFVILLSESILIRLIFVQNKQNLYNKLVYNENGIIGLKFWIITSLVTFSVSTLCFLISRSLIDYLMLTIFTIVTKSMLLIYYNYKFSKRPKSLEEFYD